jgi:hypothetical protein
VPFSSIKFYHSLFSILCSRIPRHRHKLFYGHQRPTTTGIPTVEGPLVEAISIKQFAVFETDVKREQELSDLLVKYSWMVEGRQAVCLNDVYNRSAQFPCHVSEYGLCTVLDIHRISAHLMIFTKCFMSPRTPQPYFPLRGKLACRIGSSCLIWVGAIVSFLNACHAILDNPIHQTLDLSKRKAPRIYVLIKGLKGDRPQEDTDSASNCKLVSRASHLSSLSSYEPATASLDLYSFIRSLCTGLACWHCARVESPGVLCP